MHQKHDEEENTEREATQARLLFLWAEPLKQLLETPWAGLEKTLSVGIWVMLWLGKESFWTWS